MARKTVKPIGAKLAPDSPFFDIIEDAYAVFACAVPDDTGVCKGCCMDPAIEADFFAPPIREMPLAYVRDWFFAAAQSPLPKATWAYLLPRVLEVLACGEDPASVGLEVSLNRFPTGDRSQWSDAQWDVLDRFQRLYLHQWLHGTAPYLDDVLCMFGLAGWPLEGLFAQVRAVPDAVLVRRLFSDWCIGRPSVWITAFWADGGNATAFAFYTSREIYDRMERIALADDTPPALAEQALAVAAVIADNADWAQPG